MPQPNTQRRWTEDTRTAFLLALRLTGGVRKAAAEIGRDIAGCYKWREREPDFAAAWDAIVAEQKAARRSALKHPGEAIPAHATVGAEPGVLAGVMRKRTRWDGVTPVKRRAFLRALAESGGVAAACARVGVSDTAIYRLRGDDADFAAAWDRALATCAPLLEQVVWERAVEGWDEPVWQGGVQVGTRRRFSETLLRQLVVAREKAVAAGTADQATLEERAKAAARAAGGHFGMPVTLEATRASILRNLDAFAQRAAEERVREAERLMALGLAP